MYFKRNVCIKLNSKLCQQGCKATFYFTHFSFKPKPILRVKKKTATLSLPAQTAAEANELAYVESALVKSLSHLSSLLSSPPLLRL